MAATRLGPQIVSLGVRKINGVANMPRRATTSMAACVPTYSRSRASDGDHAPARTCAVPGWKDEAAPPSISLHAGAGWQPQVYWCLIRRLPRAGGSVIWPWPYARYQGFCTHQAPEPGVAVIMHCSYEVKPQFVPLLRP